MNFLSSLIFINGIYDLICGCSILITDNYLSKIHLHLFIKPPDNITKIFLAYWIITYGSIKSSIIFNDKSNELLTLSAISYLLELVIFEYELYISKNLIINEIRIISILSTIFFIGCII